MITSFAWVLGMFVAGFFDSLLRNAIAQLQQFYEIMGKVDSIGFALFGIIVFILAAFIAYSILLFLGRQTIETAKDRGSGLTLRAITKVLPCRVCYINSEGELLYCNRPGYEEFYGQRLVDKLRSTDKKIFEAYFQACLNGEPMQIEMESIFGGPGIDEIRFLPHRASSGKVCGVICITTDVSPFRIIEKELSAAKQAADFANAAKTAFLANMSHEIRTPLGAVLGFSDLLANPDISPYEREKYIQAIKRNGILLKTLIDDILDLTKVEAGKIDLEIQTISLQELIDDILSYLEVQATTKGTRLLLMPAKNLPSQIESDPTRLRQILINIVGNAIKFTPGGLVEVIIDYIEDKKQLAFCVKDDGPGISPKIASSLFNAFEQGDASINGQFGGTGLGLVLSRRFARLLGGDVVLTKSEPGIGSQLTITIDASQPITLKTESDTQAKDVGAVLREKELMGLRILLAEDAPDNQLLIGTYLESAGADYEIAHNGLDALDKIGASKRFDLVLLDIQMPVMDGYAAAEAMRLRGYTMPLIALTAHTMQDERERCLARGFDEHLSKPIDPKVLIERIQDLAAKHRDSAYFNLVVQTSI
jgi:signal transduction histidine kinase/CheY-like chemotaxis protein